MPRPVTTSPATGYDMYCAGMKSGKTDLHLLCNKSLIVVGNHIDRTTNFTSLATSRTISLLQVADQSGTGLIVRLLASYRRKKHDQAKTTLGLTTDMVAGNHRFNVTGA